MLDSDKVEDYDKEIVKQLIRGNASVKDTKGSLLLLTRLMQALKDNQALRFAVITGCLKIAKESIFTGTNNFVSDTITDSRLNEYFGFVQSEVDQILRDADAENRAASIKEWYDGYHFGDSDGGRLYCSESG